MRSSNRFARFGGFGSAAGSLADRATGALLDACLGRELRVWERAGRAPCLWWRDDDARRPSEPLDRLLALSTVHQIPLTLAVIPDGDMRALSQVIARHPLVSVIQHGCDHVDRNIDGGFSAEFSPLAPAAEIAGVINRGWDNLADTGRAIPIYAPPWNVLTPNARAALRDTPFRTVSLYGKQTGRQDGLVEVNTHVDIMRWRPARFRGHAATLQRLWRQLRVRRVSRNWDEPIGVLTHHKNLDPAAWLFLERFLARWSRLGGGSCWRPAGVLLEQRRRGPSSGA